MLMEHLNWMQVEEYLKNDDRIVLVTGATEEHGYNSLGTDTQCPWEMAREACDREASCWRLPFPMAHRPFSLAYPAPSASAWKPTWPTLAIS